MIIERSWRRLSQINGTVTQRLECGDPSEARHIDVPVNEGMGRTVGGANLGVTLIVGTELVPSKQLVFIAVLLYERRVLLVGGQSFNSMGNWLWQGTREVRNLA